MSENTTPSGKIRTDVATAIAASSPKVREMVIEKLCQDEIQRRTQSTLTILDQIDAKTRELRKAEGSGTKNYDLSGAEVGTSIFTKQQIEDMKKQKEHIAKLQGVLEKAFELGDFSKLYELLNTLPWWDYANHQTDLDSKNATTRY